MGTELWCHTCKRAFSAVIDNSFNYSCPCGSEYIEEISRENDPRLFDASTRGQGSSLNASRRIDEEDSSSRSDMLFSPMGDLFMEDSVILMSNGR